MTMSGPGPKRSGWAAAGSREPVRLILSREDMIVGDWIGASAAGFPIEVVVADSDQAPDDASLRGAAALVIEVVEGLPSSLARFIALAEGVTPVVAAVHDPSLGFVRQLVRFGAHDVVPLPLELTELNSALEAIGRQRAAASPPGRAAQAKLVVVIKSEGGTGATALLGQLAARFASAEAAVGRSSCLIDLDMQFGDAAFQLGLQPSLTLADLIAAGPRVDGELLRATTSPHPTGLSVIAAPREIMPLDAIGDDDMIRLIEVASAEFDTLFVDLPANWTNWSLSLLARADLVLMVTQLSVASLHRARRQLDLLNSQKLGSISLKLIVNRFEKRLLSKISASDVERVLGRAPDFMIANDYETMTEAIERGVPLADIRRKGPLARDLHKLEIGVAAALGCAR